jgi:predicted O-methyltransferase YrrM
LTIANIVYAEIPEPYRSIADLPFDDHGWFINQDQLRAILASHSPKTVIEVGSWLGSSTRFIASRLPKKNGKLYAVDTWQGSPNEEIHMKDPRLPYLYQLFLSNIKHAQLTNIIVPIRMDSIEASNALNVKADLIYIDAGHETENVYQDILAWYPHLVSGGVLCGDDWMWESVREGVIRAADVLNLKIIAQGNFWRFE